MNRILVCGVLGLLLFAPAAWAGKAYVGAGVGSSSAELQGGSSQIDFDDTGYMAYAGYRVLRNLSAELSYTDFGSPSETIGTTVYDADLQIAALWAVGILTVTPNLELYGRLGYTAWDATVEVTDGIDPPEATDSDGNDLGWGAGLGYNITPSLGLEVDWYNYDLGDSGDVDFTALSVRFRF